MNVVTIEVPASTSNLGPGYDCLGVALRLSNRITVRRLRREAAVDGLASSRMVHEAVCTFWQQSGVESFPFSCEIAGDVPVSRGLGSSVTLRLGVLTGLNTLANRPLTRQELFEICSTLEGHPDNAAPAQFGGFTVAGGGEEGHGVVRFAVSRHLHFVLLVPDFEIRTDDARKLLPEEVSRRAAVASSARACRITAAFAARRYEALRDTFEDGAFHQPHRLPLIPFLPEVLAAGRAAGALGGFLSGSGSTICCLTLESPEAVADAMRGACGQSGARTVVTAADNRGARAAR